MIRLNLNRGMRLAATTATLALMGGAAWAQASAQSPVLDAAVESGALPPVAERVGAEPRVLEVVDKIGTYGGTHRAALVGGNDRNMLLKFTGYEPLLAWDREWSGELIPNVAKSVEASDDAKSFTFVLREGMKWSDGTPFGAQDIAFMVNDVLTDETLYPSAPGWMLADGKLPTATVESPTRVRIDFAAPNGLFLQNVASPFGTKLVLMSKEYCSKYMPKFNEEAEALAAAADAADWAEHLTNQCGVGEENIQRWRNPEMPTLNAFMIEEPYVSGATQVTFKRNPYYWKVDAEGNQLPYIDEARFSINADKQTALLAAVAGETTFQQRHIATTDNLPVLAAAQEDAGIVIVPRVQERGSDVSIAFNQTSTDPVKRDFFDDLEFRAALSHGIDRQAIIDSIYLGLGEPSQPGPSETSPYYNERLDKQYLEYDVEKANAMLDELGYDKRDSNGMRLNADGNPITFNVMTVSALGSFVDLGELVTQYWQELGIDARMQTVDRTRFYEVKNGNEHDVVIWGGGGNGAEGLLDPRYYLPFSSESTFGVDWVNWFDGNGGEEPPANVKKQRELYDAIKMTSDQAEQTRMFNEILDIAADNFFVMGISTPPKQYAVRAKNLMNVTEGTATSWIYPNPGPTNPEQWFFEQE
ncbi:ABC transporter substrate-binding protein (plasmid) [Falsihalocynthiibacter sp. SS001]|uniref:ABC transporter substrate-binding protein n=1 Tax=Falsihalocynthiibacter sp. SS001 TaxID=3349698 RepID=UPI0036D38861